MIVILKFLMIKRRNIENEFRDFIDTYKEFMIFMRNKNNELFLGKIGEKFEVV